MQQQPPQQGSYGGYGAQPQQQWGPPPPTAPGAPPLQGQPQGQWGSSAPPQGAYGAPAPQQQQPGQWCGAPQQQGAYGAPQGQWGAGAPSSPQQQGQWGSSAPPPPQQQAQGQPWSGMPPSTAPQPQQQGQWGAPAAKQLPTPPGATPPPPQQQAQGQPWGGMPPSTAPQPQQQGQWGGAYGGGGMPQPPPQQQQQQQQQWGGMPQQPGFVPQQSSGGPQQQGMWYAQQYGQQQQQQQQQSDIQRMFQQLDRDRSGTIALDELKNGNFYGKHLSYDTVRKVMSVFDTSRTGQISFEVFAYMHRFIKDTLDNYNSLLAGRSTLTLEQTMQALQRQGVRHDEGIVRSTVKAFRHSRQPETRAQQAHPTDGITFDEYLELITHFALMRSAFERRDPSHTGKLQLTQDELLGLAIEIL